MAQPLWSLTLVRSNERSYALLWAGLSRPPLKHPQRHHVLPTCPDYPSEVIGPHEPLCAELLWCRYPRRNYLLPEAKRREVEF